MVLGGVLSCAASPSGITSAANNVIAAMHLSLASFIICSFLFGSSENVGLIDRAVQRPERSRLPHLGIALGTRPP
jgi:hypothetical protein